MGMVVHQAIACTTWSDGLFELARKKAHELGLTPLVQPEEGINGYRSFFVPPCGSGVGWEDAERHLERIGRFMLWASRAPEHWPEGYGPEVVLLVYGEADHFTNRVHVSS